MALNFVRPGVSAPATPAAGKAAPVVPAAAPATGKALAVATRAVTPQRTAGSIFAGVEAAKASFAANYMKEGRYYALLRNVKEIHTRKNGPAVVIEMTILAKLPCEKSDHHIGEEVSHMLMASNDSFLPNLKAFVAAVAGCADDEVTEAVCAAIAPLDTSGVNSDLAGVLVEVEGQGITTKAGDPFTRVTYRRSVRATDVAEAIEEKDLKAVDLALGGVGRLEALVVAESEQPAQ